MLSIAAKGRQWSIVYFLFYWLRFISLQEHVEQWEADNLPWTETAQGMYDNPVGLELKVMLTMYVDCVNPIVYSHGRGLLSAVDFYIGRENSGLGTGLVKQFTKTWLKTRNTSVKKYIALNLGCHHADNTVVNHKCWA